MTALAAHDAIFGSSDLGRRTYQELLEDAKILCQPFDLGTELFELKETHKNGFKLGWGPGRRPQWDMNGIMQGVFRSAKMGFSKVCGGGYTSDRLGASRNARNWAIRVSKFSIQDRVHRRIFEGAQKAFLHMANLYKKDEDKTTYNNYTFAADKIFECINRAEVSVHADIAKKANGLSRKDRDTLFRIMQKPCMYNTGWPPLPGVEVEAARRSMSVSVLEATLLDGAAGAGVGGAGEARGRTEEEDELFDGPPLPAAAGGRLRVVPAQGGRLGILGL